MSIIYKGDAIQILGQRKDQSFLQSVLIPSRCYTIEKYGCGVTDRYQKWLDNDVYITIGTASSITTVPDVLHSQILV